MTTRDAILRLCDLFDQPTLKALLCAETFFTDPGAIRYHHDYVGGLADHSFGVWCRLMDLATSQYDPKTLFRVAMIHDLGKVGTYISAVKNQKRVGADGRAVLDRFGKFIWDEVSAFDHSPHPAPVLGPRGLSIFRALAAGIQMSNDELMVVRWHMGAYDDNAGEAMLRMKRAIELCPLVAIMQAADVLDANIPQGNEDREVMFRNIEGADFLKRFQPKAEVRPTALDNQDLPF